MSPKTPINFRIDDELIEALKRLKERDGVPVSEQVRRAVKAWVESKGETVKGGKAKPRK